MCKLIRDIFGAGHKRHSPQLQGPLLQEYLGSFFFLRLKDFLMGTKDEISLSGQVSLKDKFFGSEVKPLTAVNGLQEVTRSEGAFTVQWKTHTCTHVAEQRSDFSPNT